MDFIFAKVTRKGIDNRSNGSIDDQWMKPYFIVLKMIAIDLIVTKNLCETP